MKKLHFIQVVPGNGIRFWWELYIQLSNFREFGYSEQCTVILFVPYVFPIYIRYEELQKQFPEVEFVIYKDEDTSVMRMIAASNYQPIIRLWSLRRYFEEHPELKNDVFFYHDSDILFVKKLDFSIYIEDDTNYLSDTKSYLNSDYFDSKEKDVDPLKLEHYKRRDILDECASFAGITRKICEENKNNTGGAQYILKNMDRKFFNDCIESCLPIRNHLRSVNQQFFKGNNPIERENNGFQSWCADMLAILWNLWRRGDKTETPKELDFLWATDERNDIRHRCIYHNAGITSEAKLTRKFGKETIECPTFYKENYNDSSPFDDEDKLNNIINNPTSSLYCASIYAEAVLKTKYKYNL